MKKIKNNSIIKKSYNANHNQESKTFGTGTPSDLSNNDPFGNL